jgi:hypothetical protein
MQPAKEGHVFPGAGADSLRPGVACAPPAPSGPNTRDTVRMVDSHGQQKHSYRNERPTPWGIQPRCNATVTAATVRVAAIRSKRNTALMVRPSMGVRPCGVSLNSSPPRRPRPRKCLKPGPAKQSPAKPGGKASWRGLRVPLSRQEHAILEHMARRKGLTVGNLFRIAFSMPPISAHRPSARQELRRRQWCAKMEAELGQGE